jgi:hypothetical protein
MNPEKIAQAMAEIKAKEDAKVAVKAAQDESSAVWDAYMVASNAERAAEDAWSAEIKAGVLANGPAEKAYFAANKKADAALRAYDKASEKSIRIGAEARDKWGI